MVNDRLIRISNKIRHSELELVENLGHGELFTRLCQDTAQISQSGLMLVNAAQQSLVLLFCLCYIAVLSLPAFVATLAHPRGRCRSSTFRHVEESQELLAAAQRQRNRVWWTRSAT